MGGGAIKKLQEWGQPVDIQGFDIRLLNEEQAEALSTLKHYNQFKFAWDNPKDNIDDKIELLLDYIPYTKLMCYVLIGFWSTPKQDLDRCLHLWEDYKVEPYVMPYNKFDTYQKQFSRYVNNKMLFKTRSWEEYKEGNRYGEKEWERVLERKRKEEWEKAHPYF